MHALAAIQQKLLEYISSELLPEGKTIDADTELVSLIDSVAVVDLIVWIESDYQLDVELEHITPETFGTVGRIAAYIEGRLAA